MGERRGGRERGEGGGGSKKDWGRWGEDSDFKEKTEWNFISEMVCFLSLEQRDLYDCKLDLLVWMRITVKHKETLTPM